MWDGWGCSCAWKGLRNASRCSLASRLHEIYRTRKYSTAPAAIRSLARTKQLQPCMAHIVRVVGRVLLALVFIWTAIGSWTVRANASSGGRESATAPHCPRPALVAMPPRPFVAVGLPLQAWDNAHEYTYSRLTDAGVMPLIQSAAGQLGTTSDSIVGLMLGAAVFLKGMGEIELWPALLPPRSMGGAAVFARPRRRRCPCLQLVLLRAGGLALAFGGEACGTVMLMLFLVPVTFFMHAPTHTGPGSLERNFDETSHLLKNGAIAGALLVLWQSIPAKDARSGGELAPRDSKKRR